MANRIRPIESKVKSVELALESINVTNAARQAGIPASTLQYDLDKVKKALPQALYNRKPGPKARKELADKADKGTRRERHAVTCPKCGEKATRNGTYWVYNWVLLLIMGWLGAQRVQIQRWRCTGCRHELFSAERARQREARQAWWCQVNRLVGLSRFKLALSVRKIRLLVQFVYGRPVSIGHVERLLRRTGQRAEDALARLSQCRQAVARFLLYDETYPKMKQRAYSLGVAMCEHGLIRSVRCIVRKAKDIPAQLCAVVGPHFCPSYFLTDLDVAFNKYMRQAG